MIDLATVRDRRGCRAEPSAGGRPARIRGTRPVRRSCQDRPTQKAPKHAQLDLTFVRSQFPAFSAPAAVGSGVLRECRRLLSLPAGGGPAAPVLHRPQGAALWRPIRRRRRAGPKWTRRATRLAAMMGVARGRGVVRPVDQRQHLCAGAGGAAVAARHGRRDRGDQSGPRGELGRLAAAGR